MTRYTVTAEQGRTRRWVFQCTEFPGAISEASRLSDAVHLMTEAISFVAEIAPSEIAIDLQVRLPETLQTDIAEVRNLLAELDRLQRVAARKSREVARSLVKDEHLTGADAAVILGVSQQRVSQLVNS